jgi:hypothetical protein
MPPRNRHRRCAFQSGAALEVNMPNYASAIVSADEAVAAIAAL